MIQIIPAVLATNEEQYQADLAKLERSEALKNGWVHIDFTDNIFVPNQTISAAQVAKYPTSLQKEAHLMIAHPLGLLDDLVKAGFKRVLFHMECEDDLGQCIDEAKSKGLEVGLVLKHETPLEKLEPFLEKIDAVLLMGVVPGFQGQPFIEESMDKVKQIKAKNWPVRVGVDGAVRDTNIKQIVEAGVDYVNVGSFLVKGDTEENFEKLWEAING